LGGQQLPPTLADLEVDVRRPPGVGHRLDRAEAVLARRGGLEATVALEVGVVLGAAGIAAVDVGAVMVDLPDLDERALDRVPPVFGTRPLSCVISPTAGVIALLTMI